MRPVDPRLLPHLRPARGSLTGVVAASTASGALLVVQAFAIARLVTSLLDGGSRDGTVQAGVTLGLVTLGRALASWLVDVLSARASTQVTATLRHRLLAAALELGPHGLSRRRSGEVALLATRGVAAIDPYLTRYIPALVVAAVLPALTLVAIATQDLPSAGIVLGTLPLVPVFAVLVGLATRDRADRQWRSLASLSGHFVDVMRGLPTLVAFRRAKTQSASIRSVTDRYRRATNETLKLAFASAAVLELVATISVALVAVTVGLRLSGGSLDLGTALVVLLLAPEAYWPLRRVGAEFHAAAEGTATFEAADEILREAEPAGSEIDASSRTGAAPETGFASETAGADAVPSRVSRPLPGDIRLTGITVGYTGRLEPVLAGFTATVPSRGVTAVVGPSGSGKSTLLAALMGHLPVRSGRITVDHHDVDPASRSWRSHIAWVSQRPWIATASVADNVRLGRPDATDLEVWRALQRVALDEVVAALPEGIYEMLAEDGAGLSAGERARLALARAVVAERALVLLDEPTAHLDPLTESVIAETVTWLGSRSAVVVVAHREALVALADQVIAVPLRRTRRRTGARLAGLVVQPRGPHHFDGLGAGSNGVGPNGDGSSAGAHVDGDGSSAGARVDGDGSSAGARVDGDGQRHQHNGKGETKGAGTSGASSLEHLSSEDRSSNEQPPGPPSPERVGVRLAFGSLLGALAAASGVALTATAGWLIVRAAEQPPILTLMVAIVGVRAFGLARPAFRYAERLVSHDVALRLLAERRAQVYDVLVPLVPGRLGRQRGDVLSAIVDDVDSLVDRFLRVRAPLAAYSAVASVATLFAAWVLPTAGVATGLTLLVGGVLAYSVSRVGVARAEGRFVAHRAALSSSALHTLHGAAELIMWQADQRAVAQVDRAGRGLSAARARSARAVAAGRAMAIMLAGLGVLTMAWVGGPAIAENRVSGPMLALLVLLPLALLEVVSPLADAGALQVRVSAADRRLGALAATTPVVSDPDEPSPAPPVTSTPSVVVDRVTAGWGAEPAFRDLDLDLPAGSRVAVVGPSGSGKSTLAAVLMRFLDPKAGEVRIATVPMTRILLDDVRRRVGLVDDDPHVFGSTVFENLRLARPEASPAEVEEALRAVHLGGWLDGLSNGLDTFLGDGYAHVSGGERARIGMARAFLADLPVLVLDEPTAQLDTTTAEAVATDLLDASSGRTVVWITHGAIGLDHVDRVLDLGERGGRVVGASVTR